MTGASPHPKPLTLPQRVQPVLGPPAYCARRFRHFWGPQQQCYPARPRFLQVRRAASHAFRSIIFITITVTVMVIAITVTAIIIVTISVAVAVVITVIVIVIVVTVLLSP